jgi:hypothetical protein
VTRQSSGEMRRENENSWPLLKDQSHHFPDMSNGARATRPSHAALRRAFAFAFAFVFVSSFVFGFSGAADGELRRAPGPGWV